MAAELQDLLMKKWGQCKVPDRQVAGDAVFQ